MLLIGARLVREAIHNIYQFSHAEYSDTGISNYVHFCFPSERPGTMGYCFSPLVFTLVLSSVLQASSVRFSHDERMNLQPGFSIDMVSPVLQTVVELEYDDNDIVDSDTSFFELQFNSRGQLTTIEEMDETRSFESKEVFGYDSIGRLKYVEKFNGSRNLQWMKMYVYDNQGRLAERKTLSAFEGVIDNGSVSERLAYTYDESNRLVESELRDSEGKLMERYGYSYNHLGQLIWVIGYSGQNKVDGYFGFAYDGCGYLRQIVQFDEGDAVNAAFEVFYDERGNCRKVTKIEPGDDETDITHNNFSLKYKAVSSGSQACNEAYVFQKPSSLFVVDSSEYDVHFQFDKGIDYYQIDKGQEYVRSGRVHSLSAGVHSVRYVSYKGMVHKRKFHIHQNDTVQFEVKNLRLTMSPNLALMNIESAWASSIIAKIGLQSARHDIFLAIGFGGGMTGNATYLINGGGYRFAFRPHKAFYINAGIQAYALIVLEEVASTFYETTYRANGALFEFGPTLGFHLGDKALSLHLEAAPLFGFDLGFMTSLGLTFPIGKGW